MRQREKHALYWKSSVKFLSFRERTAWVLEMKGMLMDKILRWGCVWFGKGEPLSCFFFFSLPTYRQSLDFWGWKSSTSSMRKGFWVLMGSRGKKVWGTQHVRRNSVPVAAESISGQIMTVGNFLRGRKYGDLWKRRCCFKLGVEFLWLLGSDCEETTLVVLQSLSEWTMHRLG